MIQGTQDPGRARLDESVRSQYDHAVRLFSQGRWDEVERLSRASLSAGQVHPLHFTLIAVTHAKLGNVEAAEKLLIALCSVLGVQALDDAERWLRALLEAELAEAVLIRLQKHVAGRASAQWGADLGSWPYMSEVEVPSMIAALRIPSRPLRVLEWGGGKSTFYFSRKLGSGDSWDSIEHDPIWFSTLEAAPRAPGGADLKLHLVPNSAPFEDGVSDGDIRSFREYVERPESLGGEFGFILVDGRARVDCLRQGWRQLARDGILVLHDAERPEYRSGYPADAFRLEMANEGLKDRKSVVFFAKSWDTLQALAGALRVALPAYVSLVPSIPREE